MNDVVVTEFMDEAALAPFAPRHRVHYDPDLHARPQEIKRLAAGAKALIVRNRTQVTADLLDALPQVRAIGRLGVGLDNIDLPACAERGIAVLPATGSNEISVAEHAFAALLYLFKPSLADSAAVAAGRWPRNPLGANEVAGRKLGIVGLGRIGRRVAARARAFDLDVVAYDPFIASADFAHAGAEAVPLGRLLAESDAVTLHCPLNETTRGLINRAVIAAMKPGGVLINTARGGIVDEAALVEAVVSGALRGALLDTFAEEPVRAGLFPDLPNLLLTAHVAGLTEEAYVRASHMVANAVLGVINALPATPPLETNLA